MFRFIVFCMVLVAVAVLTLSAEFMVDGIKREREHIIARNAVEEKTIQAQESGPSFDEIYAGADAQINEGGPHVTTPEDLSAIAPAAGGINDTNVQDQPAALADDTFGAGFVGTSPKAFGEDNK